MKISRECFLRYPVTVNYKYCNNDYKSYYQVTRKQFAKIIRHPSVLFLGKECMNLTFKFRYFLLFLAKFVTDYDDKWEKASQVDLGYLWFEK